MTVNALCGWRNNIAKQTMTIVQVPHVNMGFVQVTAVATEDMLVNTVNQKSMNAILLLVLTILTVATMLTLFSAFVTPVSLETNVKQTLASVSSILV